MRINTYFKTIYVLILSSIFIQNTVFAVRRLPTTMLRPPRLTIVIVIDSCGYHYMQKLLPYFGYGFNTLVHKGVVYTNAYWPHGTPSTGPGHVALNSGVYGRDSGIIANSWFDKQGHKVECDDDKSSDAAVLSPDGVYEHGKSPRNIISYGVSDSLAVQNQPCAKTKVFGISLKSRASIGMVGKNARNQAIWFDSSTGLMTSSRYYGESLPSWVTAFNKTSHISELKEIKWNLMYPEDGEYYCFNGIQSKESARSTIRLISGKAVHGKSSKELFELFEKTPAANKMLFDCARTCIKANLGCDCDDRMLLWISLSPLDKLSHIYGPDSLEVVDLMYHLDYQLQEFIDFVDKQLKRSDVLYVLTADHGMASIPEYLNEQKCPAVRDDVHDIEKQISDAVTQKVGKKIKVAIKAPNLYLLGEFGTLNKQQKKEVLKIAKDILLEQKCVKNAWTNAELDALNLPADHIESFFKLQRFPGRSGDLIIQTAPFSQLTKYKGGTTHEGPYEVNTHVPLIIYRHKFFERKLVNAKVSMLQLANTLAHTLHIPKPSASTFPILPGLFPDEQDFVL